MASEGRIDSSTFEAANSYFDQILTSLNLSKSEIERQSLTELEQSLERINDALKNPGSFGTARIKITGKGSLVIATTSTEATFEIGILPVLLDRKRLVLTRIAFLTGQKGVEDIANLVSKGVDPAVKDQVESHVVALKADLSDLETRAKDANEAQVRALAEQESSLLELRTALFERRSKVWKDYLARESVATLIGAILLIGLTATLIVAMFNGTTVSQVLSSAFLLILGYFFGQASGRQGPKTGSNED